MNGLQEMCYLPTWPVGFPPMGRSHPPRDPERPTSCNFRTMVMESLAEDIRNIVKPQPGEWIRPQPKCVRRIGPYN
jgi:hypothetical protein